MYCLRLSRWLPSHLVQQVAVPGAVSLIPAWPYTFGEIDREIFSSVILLLALLLNLFRYGS